jgi:hypothetical protein
MLGIWPGRVSETLELPGSSFVSMCGFLQIFGDLVLDYDICRRAYTKGVEQFCYTVVFLAYDKSTFRPMKAIAFSDIMECGDLDLFFVMIGGVQ